MAYSDFLEGLLKREVVGRQARNKLMLARVAGCPVVKTRLQRPPILANRSNSIYADGILVCLLHPPRYARCSGCWSEGANYKIPRLDIAAICAINVGSL